MTKKNAYYAKHKQSANRPREADWIKNNSDLLNVLNHPHKFSDLFLELPYNRQIAMVQTLIDIVNNKLRFNKSHLGKDLVDMAVLHLESIHWLTGSFYEEGNGYSVISDDEKKLVRMECYGSIDIRRDHDELSNLYKYFKSHPTAKKHPLSEYNMVQSPIWRVYSQFKSFRSITKSIKQYLRNNNIHPDALKVMSVNDFSDVIYETFATPDDSSRAYFIPQGYKNVFVKKFMDICGADLEKHMVDRGADPRAAHALCRIMSKYGNCDVDTLVVTETRYTPRIIKDLSKHGYDTSDIKVGQKIPEEVLDKFFDEKKEALLLARDEDGYLIDKSTLPRYEVHHKNAVKFSGESEYLAKANYDTNLMLVETSMHHVYYHGLDKIIRGSHGDDEYYYARININIPGICLIDGFNMKNDAFLYDFANDAENKRREKTDKRYVVNYYSMQLERLNNIIEIAEKYDIYYSKNAVNTERNRFNDLLERKIEIPGEMMSNISSWLKQKKKGHGR